MGSRRTDLYRVEGVRVPSVTEILKIVGLSSFDNVDADVLEYARQRGEKVHAICDAIDNDLMWIDDPMAAELKPYIAAYLKFKHETGFQSVHSERVVVSKTYRYAGTLDRAGVMPLWNQKKDQVVVVDLKAVAEVGRATALQTAGYALALSETTGHENLGRAAVQLLPNGKYSLHPYAGAKADVNTWLACVRIAHWQLGNGVASLREH